MMVVLPKQRLFNFSRTQNLLHPSPFFFSSVSASANSSSNSNSSPKFPIPSYDGKSQPIPKSIIPPPPPNHMQQDHQIEIASIIRPSFQSQTPILLQNLVSSCDAIYFWRSLDYWRLAVGADTAVEIEVGKSYNSANRVPTRFGDYLDYLALGLEQEKKEYEQIQLNEGQHVKKQQKEQEIAYLAQTELFPQVLDDVPTPSFCENGDYNVGEGKLYHKMLWMGPRHTVSPLHFDPLDNLLMQVVGWKRVLLFSPGNQSSEDDIKGKLSNRLSNEPLWHYAGVKGQQYNTSAVDIENPDHGRFPNFKASAPTPYECILGPGDCLYIPKKWWHHVRSLEFSVSANVWWR